MQKFGEFICKKKVLVLIISLILLILAFLGNALTKINYDILVYLPEDIETIKGQNTLTDDFNMGSYSIAIIDNMSASKILELEEKISAVKGVGKVASIYDVIGTTIPVEMLPNEVVSKLHHDNTDLLFITFDDSTSSEETIDAVREIRKLTNEEVRYGGMSSMVLDTMELSDKEIVIYIVIAVLLCILVLEVSLDSYIVPFILLTNIGCAIMYNLGTNVFLGQISYITKALVAVLQLGVTTDFSIFLYHSYEKKKKEFTNREEAMVSAIKETFTSVTGSSLTTIAGFLVLCTMKLTLGTDLGIVMAKGVLIGVICVLTLFPSLLLFFDKYVEKTKHKSMIPKFDGLNKIIIKYHKVIFTIFVILLVPAYLAYSKVDVYYKIDKTLPNTLESIIANERTKNEFNIVSPEMILLSKDLKNDQVLELTNKLEEVEGVSFVLNYAKIKDNGISEDFLSEDLVKMFENDKYQMLLLNSVYDVASDELNSQVEVIDKLVKSYDKDAIVAGEGALMKDLIKISDEDFRNVNYSSIACIFIILIFVLKSFSLPVLLIATIEFAIFMNMGVSYFGGIVLPFVAPIVLGTIQLGATIDYAILMTTTYRNKRKDGINKNEAMLETLNYCGTSILISGMCFFGATFGVGVYSDLEMVGSLCTLISRGAIISMLVVIMILPSILLIFDRIIIRKKKEVNMKNNVRKMAVWTLIGLMSISCIPVNAATIKKNETVYSKLNSNGSVKSTIVSEELTNNNSLEKIDDYSILEEITNLSNDSKYSKDGKNITWDAYGNNILYQGKTSEKLPISLNITYKLNNEEKELKDILGEKGKVTITLKYQNREAHNAYINGKYETIYTPFVVGFGTILDNQKNTNISVDNGRVINNGVKSFIVGYATPGLYESLKTNKLKGMDTITISFNTESFELSSMYSIITPNLIELDDLNVFGKINGIYSDVDKLQTNMDAIDAGAKKLKAGSNELKTKLGTSLSGIKVGKTLTDEQVENITNMAVSKTKETLTKDYKANVANKTWSEVKESLKTADKTKSTEIVTDSVTKAVVEYLNSVSLYQDYVACETGKAYMAQTGAMSDEQKASCAKIASDTTLPLVMKAATTAASSSATNITNYVAENVSKQVAVSVLEQTAIGTTSKVASNLSNQIASGVASEMTTALTNIYNGVCMIDNGINELSTGISTYNKEGINKISNLVNGDLKSYKDRVENLSNLSSNYHTFAGNTKNTKGTTKFVLVVDGEKKEVKQEIKQEETKKISIWERFLNLFR